MRRVRAVTPWSGRSLSVRPLGLSGCACGATSRVGKWSCHGPHGGRRAALGPATRPTLLANVLLRACRAARGRATPEGPSWRGCCPRHSACRATHGRATPAGPGVISRGANSPREPPKLDEGERVGLESGSRPISPAKFARHHIWLWGTPVGFRRRFMGQVGRCLAEIWTNLAYFGLIWSTLGNFGRGWAKFGPKLANCGRCLPRVWPHLAKFGRGT